MVKNGAGAHSGSSAFLILLPQLLSLQLETNSSHQSTEKPQNLPNDFRVVQTLSQPNPNRHLRNNYFLEFLELLWSFWTTTLFACHFLFPVWCSLSLWSGMKIGWARMKKDYISRFNHPALHCGLGAIQVKPWSPLGGMKPKLSSQSHSPHPQSPGLQLYAILDTKQQEVILVNSWASWRLCSRKINAL